MKLKHVQLSQKKTRSIDHIKNTLEHFYPYFIRGTTTSTGESVKIIFPEYL